RRQAKAGEENVRGREQCEEVLVHLTFPRIITIISFDLRPASRTGAALVCVHWLGPYETAASEPSQCPGLLSVAFGDGHDYAAGCGSTVAASRFPTGQVTKSALIASNIQRADHRCNRRLLDWSFSP